MPESIAVVDWTAVCTIVGVVFAVAIAALTALLGNRTLGKYNLKLRKYELFFEQKCSAFVGYIDYSSRVWAANDLKLLLGPEFEAISRRAALFACPETREAIAKLNFGLVVWAKASFDEDGTPDVITLFSNVTELMQKELAKEAGD